MQRGKRKSSSAEKALAFSKKKPKIVEEKKEEVKEDEEASPIPDREYPVEQPKVEDEEDDVEESRFIGDAVPIDEARQRWPHRYLKKNVRLCFTHCIHLLSLCTYVVVPDVWRT